MARGRKAAPILWRPDVVDSKGPIYVDSLAYQPMGKVLSMIGELPDPDFFEDKVITVSDIQLRYAVADVIRRRWYPKMRVAMRGKPLCPVGKNLAKIEGLLLSRLLSMIQEVFLIDSCGYSHPAYLWLDCCLELGTHRPMLTRENLPSRSKSGLLSPYEGNTAKLKKRRNPFQAGTSKRLFDAACKLANEASNSYEDRDSELFYPSKYLPYIEARSKLAAFLRKKGTKIIKGSEDESI